MFNLCHTINNWNMFFFEPVSIFGLGLFRISIGLLLCIKAVGLSKKRSIEFLCGNSFYPKQRWQQINRNLFFSIFAYFDNHKVVAKYLCIGLFFSGICLMCGYESNLAAFFAYICWISITHRNSYMFNSGDSLLRLLLILLSFSNSGEVLSLINYLNNKEYIDVIGNPLVLRLMQIQVLAVYICACYHKINNGVDWLNGLAFYYAINNKLVNRYHVFMNMNIYFAKCMNYLVFFVQLLCPMGLCFNETKYYCIALLLCDHIGAEILLRVGMFGILMSICLLLFI